MRSLTLVLLLLLFSVSPAYSAALSSLEIRDGSEQERGVWLTFDADVDAGVLGQALKLTPHLPGQKLEAESGKRKYFLRGKFRSGREYQLTIARVALSVGGREQEVLQAAERSFRAPGPRAQAELNTVRRVVERIGRQLLPLRLRHVELLDVSLRPVPPLLALPTTAAATDETLLDRWLDRQSPGLSSLGGRADAAPFQSFLAGTDGEMKESFHIGPEEERFALPLSWRRDAERGGLFRLAFCGRGPGQETRQQAQIQVTDLTLHYKFSPRRLLFWVTSLHDAQPLPGVEILLIRRDNARIAAGQTDARGLLLLEEGRSLPTLLLEENDWPIRQEALSVKEIVAAVAVSPTDAACISLSAHRIFVPGSKPASEEEARTIHCQGRLFSERGVYRPGETVYFKGALRIRHDNQVRPPLQDTLAVVLQGPDGKEIHRSEVYLTEFGTVAGSIPLPGYASLGQYRLTVEGIEKRTHKILENFHVSTSFQVQEFEPPRFKIDLDFAPRSLERPGYVGTRVAGRVVDVGILPRYYAGGPLRHARVRWKAELVGASWELDGQDAYRFGSNDREELLLESGEGMTDGAGRLTVTIPLDPAQFSGAGALRVSATALDVDGRSATGVDSWQPRPVWQIGIAAPAGPFRVGEAQEFRAIVLDAAGNAATGGTLDVTVMKKDWFYLLKRNDEGELTYSWDEGWTEDYRLTLPLTGGRALIPLAMNEGGSYRLQLAYGEGEARSSAVYAWDVDWSWNEDYDDPQANEKREVLRARQLAVFSDRSTVRPGDPVKMEFRARRALTWCLVTVERDDILQADVIPVQGTRGEYQLTAEVAHAPNVYLSFTGICPRGDYPVYGFQVDVDAPHSFHAMEKLTVLDGRPGLKLAIAPDQPRLKFAPGQTVELELTLRDPEDKPTDAEITLVAVDEAVLALTRFPTPSFQGLERFTLPLQVLSGSLLWDLVSQDAFRLLQARPLTGGGGGAGNLLSSMDLRRDFHPLACFLPDLRPGTDGRARARFRLPDTTTTYRVYALACDRGHAFATAERDMLVSKEFFLDPALPRFLVAGDSFRSPLTLVNRGEKRGVAVLEVTGSGSVELSAERDTASLEAESRSTVRLHGRACGAGEAELRFAARFEGLQDGLEETRPVLSRRIRRQRHLAGDFRGQERIELDEWLDDLRKMSPAQRAEERPRARLSIGRTPWNRIEPALRYLLHYPYGCVEQTSSGLIPLLAIRRLVRQGLAPGVDGDELDRFIRSGIERLVRMHRSGEGFSYWPGGGSSVFSGTAYALYALTEARDAGYAVPSSVVAESLEWLRKESFAKQTEQNRSWSFTALAPLLLARHGRIAASDLKVLCPDLPDEGLEATTLRALTMLALKAETPKKLARRFRRLKAEKSLEKEDSWHRFRTAGLLLLLSLELGDPQALAPDNLAGWLLRHLGPEGRWRSTADTGFCLLGLARWLEMSPPPSDGELQLQFQPAVAGPLRLGSGEVMLELNMEALLTEAALEIRADRPALLSWCLQLDLPLADEATDDTGNVVLQKEIIPPAGQDSVRLGDVVKVRLTLELPRNAKENWTEYEYLVIDDPLPAGLVALNTDLAAEASHTSLEEEADDCWQDGYYIFRPDHREFRTDRLLAFRDRVWSGRFQYEYWARAVAEGEFWVRPTQVRLMYRDDCFGLLPGRPFTVLPGE